MDIQRFYEVLTVFNFLKCLSERLIYKKWEVQHLKLFGDSPTLCYILSIYNS